MIRCYCITTRLTFTIYLSPLASILPFYTLHDRFVFTADLYKALRACCTCRLWANFSCSVTLNARTALELPMSTPATEVVAVACVVESSLILASEWSRVLVDYVFPLLKRLGEAHTVGHQMSVCKAVTCTLYPC